MTVDKIILSVNVVFEAEVSIVSPPVPMTLLTTTASAPVIFKDFTSLSSTEDPLAIFIAPSTVLSATYEFTPAVKAHPPVKTLPVYVLLVGVENDWPAIPLAPL